MHFVLFYRYDAPTERIGNRKTNTLSLFPQIVCKSFALALIVTRKTLEECDNCSTPWNIGRITRHYLFNKFSRENLTLIKQQVPFYRICGDVLSTPRQPPSSLGGRRLETRTIGRWKGGEGARGGRVGGAREGSGDMSRTLTAIIISYFAFRVPDMETIGNDVFFRLARWGWKSIFCPPLSINASPTQVFVLVLYRGCVMILIPVRVSVCCFGVVVLRNFYWTR